MPCAGDLDDASTPTFNGLTVETGGSGAKGRRETRAYLGDQKISTLPPHYPSRHTLELLNHPMRVKDEGPGPPPLTWVRDKLKNTASNYTMKYFNGHRNHGQPYS